MSEEQEKQDVEITDARRASTKRRFKGIRDFWKQYRRSKLGLTGLVVFVIFIFMAVFGPAIAPYGPNSAGSFPKAHPIWAEPAFMSVFAPSRGIVDTTETFGPNDAGKFNDPSAINLDPANTERDGFDVYEYHKEMPDDVVAQIKAAHPECTILGWVPNQCDQYIADFATEQVKDPANGTDSKLGPVQIVADPFDASNNVLHFRFNDTSTSPETHRLVMNFTFPWNFVQIPNEANFYFEMLVFGPGDDGKDYVPSEWQMTRTPENVSADDVVKDNMLSVSLQARNEGYFSRPSVVEECQDASSSGDQVNLKCKDVEKSMASPPYYHTGWSTTTSANVFLTVDERTQLFSDQGEMVFTLVFKFDGEGSRDRFQGAMDVFVDNFKLVIPTNYSGFLGANNKGEDIFSQLIWGTYVSIVVGILATFMSITIGIVVGLASGYAGGFVDDVIMRAVDFLLIMPGLPLLLALAAVLEPSFWNIIIVIGLLGWTGTARLIRSQVMVEKEKAYVESAKAAGASDTYILFRHILPNVLPMVFAVFATSISGAILSEASLAFLGLGDYFTPSWGQMLNIAQSTGAATQGYWWVVLPPGFAIAMLSLSFALIGYTTQQIMNPRLKSRG